MVDHLTCFHSLWGAKGQIYGFIRHDLGGNEKISPRVVKHALLNNENRKDEYSS